MKRNSSSFVTGLAGAVLVTALAGLFGCHVHFQERHVHYHGEDAAEVSAEVGNDSALSAIDKAIQGASDAGNAQAAQGE